jgi:hypothetical protein
MVDVVDLAVVELAVVLVLNLEPVGQIGEEAQVAEVVLLQVLVEGEVEDLSVLHCQSLRRRPLRVQRLLKREKIRGGA